MTDFLGNELNIGDIVAITVTSGTSVANLRKGIIKGFHRTAGYDVAEVHCDIQNDEYSTMFLYPKDINVSSTKIIKITNV